MATVPSASPRPSLSQIRSPASSRTSLDTVSTVTRGDAPVAPRRNRAALRDYYRLKSPTHNESAQSQSLTARSDVSAAPPTRLDALDRDGFDAGSYVKQLLEIENLEGLLNVENELVGEVRALDGERKALVYDNYSKLIAATETIMKMRVNMDPLAPATVTLGPAVAHIADTAVSLSTELATDESANENEAQSLRKQQLQLIQRALKGPETLQQMLHDGREDEARTEWSLLQSILDRCANAKDTTELREKCQEIMSAADSASDEG